MGTVPPEAVQEQAVPAGPEVAAPAIGPELAGPLGAVLALQGAAGNRAVARLMRQPDGGGGMSSPSGASQPGSAPNASTPTPGQTASRGNIDAAKRDFTQAAFRDIHDWSGATDAERIELIDKATDPKWFWLGPDDEDALERAWSSFGDRFETAVQSNPGAWTRSVQRGADPDRIAQTKGKYRQFKLEVVALARKNLTANEDKIVAEMAEFGLPPPVELLRLDNPARKSLDVPAPKLGGPSPTDRLKEQARLAKVLLDHKAALDQLKLCNVGIPPRKFDPGSPTLSHEDIPIFNGLSSWESVKKTWDRVSREVALIVNAWPILYGAYTRGGLDAIASQKYDAAPLTKEAGEQTQAGLGQVTEQFRTTLTNIRTVREDLLDDDVEVQDYAPVYRALFDGRSPSGAKWPRAVWLPVMNDERELKSDIDAAAKFAADVALFVAMVAGVVGTMGGAAIAVAMAGATMMEADEKAGKLSAAHGAAVSDDTALVTKTAVDAATAEAEWQRIQFAVVAITSALTIGVEAAAAHLDTSKMQQGLSSAAAEGSEAAGARRALAGAEADASRGPKTPMPPEAADKFRSWGSIPVEKRPEALGELVNKRLAAEGVPPVQVSKGGSGQAGTGAGAFRRGSWEMALSDGYFTKESLTEAEFWDMVDSAYHEARHAKQYWEAARWKAGDGTYSSAEQMAERLKLDPKMTRKAWDAKMAPEDPNAAFGKRMFQSLFSEETLEVKAEITAAEDFLAAKRSELKALPKDASSGKRKLAEMAVDLGEERMSEALAKERQLAHEADAYEAAGRVTRWGRQGIAGNPQVQGAEEVVDSVRVRVRIATDKSTSLKLQSASADQMAEAELELQLANDDLTKAEGKLAVVRRDARGGW